jgi:DNA-binding transcriptional MerR regulator
VKRVLWWIPGTTLQADSSDAQQVHSQFQGLFLAGGVTLSQVSSITGLEPHVIQNWVKRGFLTPPQKKRYSMSQLCRIIHINMLRAVLPLEQICKLLTYINGDLSDHSDDLIDDAQLYFLFVRLAAAHRKMHDPKGRDAYLEELLLEYEEPVPGAKERIGQVLQVMLTAWAAALMCRQAEEMMHKLQISSEKTANCGN